VFSIKIRFFGGFAAEKTPLARAEGSRQNPQILTGGDKRA
jgi:hypothetical protein